MKVSEAIYNRKSIRVFEDREIDRKLIEEVMEKAILAPSAINLQPWEFTLVYGEERRRLSRRLIKAYKEKRLSCAPGAVSKLPEIYIRRQRDSFKEMGSILKEKGLTFQEFINEGSCNFYGAPLAIIITQDTCFSTRRHIDIGIVLAYIMLLLEEIHLASCPIGLIAQYEDEIKDQLNIPEDKRVVMGLAVGYAKSDDPLNSIRIPRDPLNKFIRWYG